MDTYEKRLGIVLDRYKKYQVPPFEHDGMLFGTSKDKPAVVPDKWANDKRLKLAPIPHGVEVTYLGRKD